MRKALREFDKKRKAEGVETLLEDEDGNHSSLNSVNCTGIWENLQVYVQEIRKNIETIKKDADRDIHMISDSIIRGSRGTPR